MGENNNQDDFKDFDNLFDTEESPAICHRCGFCCKKFNAIIPMNIDSNLSPEYLNGIIMSKGFEYMESYFEKNGTSQGEPCIWLIYKEDGTTACSAYERRGVECRRYPYWPQDNECQTGKVWLKERYNKNPEELRELLLMSIFERMKSVD
jgi:Fe-S-cluster containining protein